MKNVFNIVKKELDKIFRNPRLVFSTFLLSPILLFVIYSTIGNTMTNEMEKMISKPSTIGIINVEENDYSHSFYQAISLYNQSYEESMKQDPSFMPSDNPYDLKYLNVNLEFYDEKVDFLELDNEKSEVYQKINSTIEQEKVDIWVVYDENFDTIMAELVNSFTTGVLEKVYPKVLYFINSYKTNTNNSVERFLTVVELQKQLFFANINLNPDVVSVQMAKDLITPTQKQNVNMQQMAMLVPMLIVIFIFAGGMGIGADLIAGEKERGTIATLLMTPINKNEIVLGKIIAGIILTSIAALCSAVGMLLSVDKLMGISGGISLSFLKIIQLIVVVILLSLLAISMFLVASTLASNIKEASMYIMPCYIVAMIVSIVPMFSQHIPTSFAPYIIPIYNIAVAIKGILIGELTGIHFALITGSTLVYFILILIFVTRLFKSERIMFAK